MVKRLGHKDHNPVDRGGGKRIAVTGQQNFSGSETAELVVRALGE